MGKTCFGFLCILCSLVWSQSKPLIMERADSLWANRRQGMLQLHGNVRFRHDSIVFTTGMATWNRKREMVICEQGFHFIHPNGSLQAQSGRYQRQGELAEAFGHVEGRDSSGEVAYFGERMIYERDKQLLELPQNPVIHRYFHDTTQQKIDTLAISAHHILYDERQQLAVVRGGVQITRGKMIVTCDSGLFNRHQNTLTLMGNPVCRLNENRLSGDSMRIVLDGERLRSVLVIRNANGEQHEKSDQNPEKYTLVEGDTLYAEFNQDRMKVLRVSVGARGKFWEEDLKEYVNRMSGDRLVIAFKKGNMELARVLGQAKSTYYYVDKKRRVLGRNESLGDSIFVAFKNKEVSNLRIAGNKATGVFYDLQDKADPSSVSVEKKD